MFKSITGPTLRDQSSRTAAVNVSLEKRRRQLSISRHVARAAGFQCLASRLVHNILSPALMPIEAVM
jgi:hypothetical protein